LKNKRITITLIAVMAAMLCFCSVVFGGREYWEYTVTPNADSLSVLNAAVQQAINDLGIPAGTTPILTFGLITSIQDENLSELGSSLGVVPSYITDANVGEDSGPSWVEQGEITDMDFDTMLSAMGYYIEIDEVGDVLQAEDDVETVDATLVNMQIQFTRDKLSELGVSDADLEFLFDSPVASADEVRESFFDEFTYFKVFDEADPALDPVDIVAWLKEADGGGYVDTFPEDFVDFEISGDNLTTGVTFTLLDAAPESGADPMKVLTIEDAVSPDLFFIWDGNNDGYFRDPVALGSEGSGTSSSGGSGGCNAGFAPAAFLLAVPLFYLARRKK